MRRISVKTYNALTNRDIKSLGNNTKVYLNEVWYHGSMIFKEDIDTVSFCMCGHPTMSTKTRINELLECFRIKDKIRQKDYTLYFKDIEISSNETVHVNK